MTGYKHIDKIVAVIAAVAAVLCLAAMGLADAPSQIYQGIFDEVELDTDWAAASTPEIRFSGDGIEAGGGAYVSGREVCICSAGDYILRGKLADGGVIINAGGHDTVRLLLDGVTLHCSDGAPLRVEQAGRVVLTLADGTENVLSDGGAYAPDAADNGVDGVLYSRDDLTVNGSGSLRIEAAYKHGLVCNDTLSVIGAALSISAPQDAVHVNDAVRIAEASLTLDAGDDGITCKNDAGGGEITVLSGSFHITACYEGLEGDTVSVSGGNISIYPTDDGVNAMSLIDISGGSLYIENSGGRDADGLDSNGDIRISGGKVVISVNTSSSALDYGSENGGTCTVSGGTVLACGGSIMAEGFDSDSPQGFIMADVSGAAGAAVSLKRADGTVLLSETVPCAFTSAVLSAPGLQVGDVCVLTVDDAVTELTVDNSASAGFGMGCRPDGVFGDHFPGDGTEGPPEGFDPSKGGGQMAGSFGPPQGGGQMPENFGPPQSNDKTQSGESQGGFDRPQMGGGRGDLGDFDPSQFGGMMPGQNRVPGQGDPSNSSAVAQNLIVYGVSFAVLAAALGFAVLYRRRFRRR